METCPSSNPGIVRFAPFGVICSENLLRLGAHDKAIVQSLSDDPNVFDIDNGWEPIGDLYGKFKRWEQVDDAIMTLSQANRNGSRSEQTEYTPGEGADASGGGSSLPTTPETPNIGSPDTPNTAHSPAASCAMIASPSSSRPPTTRWNQARGRPGDTALPAAGWSRHLGGRMPTANSFSVFLPEDQPLSDYQTARFWTIVKDCRQIQNNNGPSPLGLDRMAQLVAEAWERQHLNVLASGENSAGYGGLIMVKHVKKLFDENGINMLKYQYQQMLQQEQTHQQPVISLGTTGAGSVPTMGTNHPQPTAKPPARKKTQEERPVHAFKGMATDSINELHKQDIIEVLRWRNKPSSNRSKEELEAVLAGALDEKANGFDLKFTYSRTVLHR
jgi:hypothetical protein